MKKLATSLITMFVLSGCSALSYQPQTERLISDAHSKIGQSNQVIGAKSLPQTISVGSEFELDGAPIRVTEKYTSALGLICFKLTSPSPQPADRTFINKKVCQNGSDWIVLQGLAKVKEGAE